MAPGPARRNSLIETLSGSGTPMVIGQPPAYRDGHRRAPGRLPGPSGRSRVAREPWPPGSHRTVRDGLPSYGSCHSAVTTEGLDQ